MRNIGNYIFILTAAAFFLIPAHPALAADEDWLLHATQDNDSTIKLLDKYLEARHGKKAEVGQRQGGMVLVYSLAPADTPEIPLIVDTFASKTDGSGLVLERVVRVQALIELADCAKTDHFQGQLLHLNNRFIKAGWVPHQLALDDQGNVTAGCYLVIPGRNLPLHPENVWDMMARMVDFWKQYYPQLVRVAPLRGQTCTGYAPAVSQPVQPACFVGAAQGD
ncbi:MAG: hypothetical protein AB1896_13385 [Thermodesulfobacteriota bacterium]